MIIKKTLLTLLVVGSFVFSSSPILAADAASQANILDDSLNDIYTVAAIGGVGAVLGLSTLSFVDKPGDHLKNIVVGSAIGIIVGVGLVAWQQATRSQNMYQEQAFVDPGMSTKTRLSWHQKHHSSLQFSPKAVGQMNYSFTF